MRSEKYRRSSRAKHLGESELHTVSYASRKRAVALAPESSRFLGERENVSPVSELTTELKNAAIGKPVL